MYNILAAAAIWFIFTKLLNIFATSVETNIYLKLHETSNKNNSFVSTQYNISISIKFLIGKNTPNHKNVYHVICKDVRAIPLIWFQTVVAATSAVIILLYSNIVKFKMSLRFVCLF